MRYWEILVFCLGISLDVFGAAVCQGAVLGELRRRRRIAAYCLIFCAAQVAAMEMGRLLGMLPRFASYYTVAQGLSYSRRAHFLCARRVSDRQGRPEKDRIRAPLRDHLQKSRRHRRPHEP